jgi:VanZ family protein
MNAKNNSSSDRIRRYLPLLLWMVIIFIASTGGFSASNTELVIKPILLWLFPRLSNERIEFIHFLVRKAGHFGEYGVLALLAARAFMYSSHRFLRRSWFIAALVFVALYSFSDEYHQSFVASRTASIYDCIIDTAGGLTALIILGLWRRFRGSQATKEAAIGDAFSTG